MQRRALLSALGTLALACGPRERPALPSAPRVASAQDLIPADLDVVARLDMARIKGVLGALASDALARAALSRAADESGEDSEPQLLSALLAADRVYFAYRPGPRLLPLDRVLVAEGRFEPLLAPPPGFGRPRDLGADLRYWERKPGGVAARATTARLYAQGDRLRAFVSEAEIDAVERALGSPPSERRLLPPSEGALSVAARPALLARLATGSLRELLEHAKAFALTFDLESDRARLEAALVLASAEDAAALEGAVGALLQQLPRSLEGTTRLTAEQDRLVLRADVGRAALAPLVACLSDAADGCSW